MTFPETVQSGGGPLQYAFVPRGSLQRPSPTTFELNEIGSFQSAFNVNRNPTQFVSIFDVEFTGAAAGLVQFTANAAESLDEGIVLDGDSRPVPANLLLFASPFRVNVVAGIQAVNDTFPVTGTLLEDQGPFVLSNVTTNDIVVREHSLVFKLSRSQPRTLAPLALLKAVIA